MEDHQTNRAQEKNAEFFSFPLSFKKNVFSNKHTVHILSVAEDRCEPLHLAQKQELLLITKENAKLYSNFGRMFGSFLQN